MKRNKTNRLLNPFPVFTECLQLVKFFLMMSILSADRFFRAGALKNQLLTGKHFIAVVFRLSHWLAEASNWSFFYMLFLNPKEAKTPPNISETRHNMLRNCCTLLHHLPQFKAREKETERRAVTCHDAKLLLKPSELASSSRASIAAAFTGNRLPPIFNEINEIPFRIWYSKNLSHKIRQRYCIRGAFLNDTICLDWRQSTLVTWKTELVCAQIYRKHKYNQRQRGVSLSTNVDIKKTTQKLLKTSLTQTYLV